MAYRVEDCTGSQEDLFSAVLTFRVILENTLISMPRFPHLLKKDNVVRIIFVKCLAHSRKNLRINSGGFWCLHAKFKLQDLLMLSVLCQHKAPAVCAILKHDFHVPHRFSFKIHLGPTSARSCESQTLNLESLII